jgi:DNA/RNA-binding domain of Phe-tRNA-synthetase-like protein
MKDIKLLDIKLSGEQKEYLKKIKDIYQDGDTPESLQISLYELTKKMGIKTMDAFSAIYQSFIGKKHGPRAGMLLASFGKDKVFERIDEVINQKIEEIDEVVNLDASGYNISKEVSTMFPGVSFAYVTIKGVKITKKDDDLEKIKSEVLDSRKDLTTEKINEIVSIKTYREMIRKTGIDYHSRRPSPDALLRRISQGKDLYTINTAVDSYNLAVITTGIGLGGFDLSKISEPVSLRLSNDKEEVFLLGDDEKSYTQKGELVYADSEKVLTIDLNYRDINETKITEKTKDIILFADGGPNIDPNDVVQALKMGADFIVRFCGGTMSDIKLVK